MKLLRINGRDIHVVRKKIKNMYLKVKDQGRSVWVHVPLAMTERQIVHFVMEHEEWLQKIIQQEEGRREALAQKRDKEPEQTREEQWREWTYLKEEITVLLQKWAPIMGVRPNGFRIKGMKTRWGSCNVRTHHMSFNLALARVPHEYLEYVVVHELTHLLEPSHNAKFWQIMEHYMPGARLLQRRLNKEYSPLAYDIKE